MNDAGSAQQPQRPGDIAQCQKVHGGTRDFAALMFHVLHHSELGAATAAGLGAV
jgi:hypothetical protein